MQVHVIGIGVISKLQGQLVDVLQIWTIFLVFHVTKLFKF